MSGADARVPRIEDWQLAAADGAPARSPVEPDGDLARPADFSARLPPDLRDEIVAWCRAGLPNEACGLLVADRSAGEGGVPSRFIGMRNAAASPYRYLIDPDDLLVIIEIEDAGEALWGIVHSHVASAPVPSATDIGLAAYPEAVFLICSLASEPPRLRGWSIRGGEVDEVRLEET